VPTVLPTLKNRWIWTQQDVVGAGVANYVCVASSADGSRLATGIESLIYFTNSKIRIILFICSS
jgi:hypothetical protein